MKIDFYKLQPPYLHIVLSEQRPFGEYAFQANSEERSLCVRVVRGNKMKRKQWLLDELSAALQFPLYFGENWDAVDECLADLEWLPADGYVLFVVNTIEVLSEEPSDQFKVFAQILYDISTEWSKAPAPKPFHVLFQCATDELDSLQRRFQWAGLDGAPDVISL